MAAIHLAIYEHSALQEAYTGALIAGKGKSLNNIYMIMERSRMRSGQWVRVRFGAGVPWRRCWCVITPPYEKKYKKMQKGLKTMFDSPKSFVFARKGDIKLYDTTEDGKKQMKAQSIATFTDAYSAYAVYPHCKSLVDASTLLKIEGNFTIHTYYPWAAEGFVFIMPEVPPGLSGCEMLLRFLIPAWDTFGLYGRPGPLIAKVLDRRSLLFAMSMSKHDHYTHLKIVDVASSIIEGDISAWTDREWRKCLQDAKVKRTEIPGACSRFSLHTTSQGMARLGFGSSGRPSIEFMDKACSVWFTCLRIGRNLRNGSEN